MKTHIGKNYGFKEVKLRGITDDYIKEFLTNVNLDGIAYFYCQLDEPENYGAVAVGYSFGGVLGAFIGNSMARDMKTSYLIAYNFEKIHLFEMPGSKTYITRWNTFAWGDICEFILSRNVKGIPYRMDIKIEDFAIGFLVKDHVNNLDRQYESVEELFKLKSSKS